jgi:hypothetical protein
LAEYKLTIELVPSTAWRKSIYQQLKKEGKSSKWNKIKADIFAKEGKKCWICGYEVDKGLAAHEFWFYDDVNNIQKLEGIHHLCLKCHMVKHLGFASLPDGQKVLADAGLTIEDIKEHFCKINQCSRDEFDKYAREQGRLHRERSKHKWTQNWGQYKEIMK